LLILACIIAFGPLWGGLYASLGTVVSGCVTYGLGRWLGRDAVRRLIGRHSRVLSRHLVAQGLPAMVTVRLLPVAPFTVVNLMAGMAGVRLHHFVLGTILGMGPGILVIAVGGRQLMRALQSPSFTAIGSVILVAVLLAGLVWFGRWMARRRKGSRSRSKRRRQASARSAGSRLTVAHNGR
jgi:uncharacterized membrane protein YdjX (TVP38/TMEM64 family)